ncbi:MAG: membrane protein insertion efficiency factor YidD [Enterobacteriaceae bacterium]|nr:membrane protein insertion efficiency factor YidD [Enterobacteriaceae bacterium]
MYRFFIFCVAFYRFFLSPLLLSRCRFFPTCSIYSKKAITKYGVLSGFYLIFKRLIRCNPFVKGGYDPLP